MTIGQANAVLFGVIGAGVVLAVLCVVLWQHGHAVGLAEGKEHRNSDIVKVERDRNDYARFLADEERGRADDIRDYNLLLAHMRQIQATVKLAMAPDEDTDE